MTPTKRPSAALSHGHIHVTAALRTQIKTRDRVRDLAEVYTHEREVNAMLDLVANMFPSEADPGNHDRKFLEPACGSGNFLEEILRRKLSTVTVRRYGHADRYEHRILRCLASIYAVDIDHDNVKESRDRLRWVIASHVDNDLVTWSVTEGFASAVNTVLATNIVRGDTLTEARAIEFIDYKSGRAGTFTRSWSHLETPPAIEQLDLFAEPPAEPKKDEVAIHYSLLADQPRAGHCRSATHRGYDVTQARASKHEVARQIRTGQHIPDILDCLAQLSNDEVPTPPKLARAMLDLLPDEVWGKADYGWLDPFCKSGIFLREVAARLLDGLSDQIPTSTSVVTTSTATCCGAPRSRR